MSKLTRQQQSSFLMSSVLDYSCVIETSENKFLMYTLKQTSDSPFSVQISNVGEKLTIPIIQLTLGETGISVKKLVDDTVGDKLPDKYIYLKDGVYVASHSMAIESSALPFFLESALNAAKKNMVSMQWVFMSLLCTRLNVEYTKLTAKASIQPFTTSDIAYCYASSIELAQQHNLPTPVIDMLKADFAQLPSDVTAPYKLIDVDAVTVSEPITKKSNGKTATTK